MSVESFEGHTPQLGERVYVHPQASVIGHVTLGDDCAVYPMAVIRGDMHHITIGDRVNVQDGSVFHVTHAGEKTHPDGYPLILHNDITVGHRVTLHGCTINDRCLIGMGSMVMDGAVVESDVMLGANTLVAPGKRLESGYLYVGQPAVKKRPLTEEELAFIPYSVANYVRLKDRYLAAMSPA